MPSLGADMEAGTLRSWRIAVGDRVKKGQVVGEVVVTRQGQQLGRVDVVAPSDVESTSWLSGWY